MWCLEGYSTKLQDGEIILQNEGTCNVHKLPFPNQDNNRGKGHAMMVYTLDQNTKEDTPM